MSKTTKRESRDVPLSAMRWLIGIGGSVALLGGLLPPELFEITTTQSLRQVGRSQSCMRRPRMKGLGA